MTRYLALILVVALGGAPPARAQEAPGQPTWTPEQAVSILRRLSEREPFAGSQEARDHGDSLGHFFGWREYQLLRGNPVFGYWSEGLFRWTGTRVAWDGIKPVGHSAHQITERAWSAAFAYVAKRNGLTIDRQAPMRIRGICLGAVLDPSIDEPNRGVVLELRIDSPSGPFLYRFGVGKPTIEDAIGASLDTAVGLARSLKSAPPPPGRR